MGAGETGSALPRFRTDLVQSRHETADGGLAVVKDPATGEFFRFGEAELFIATQLDGATELDEVQRRVEAQCGEPLAPGTLAAFVKDLERRGLLERPGRHSRRHAPKRISGTLLHLRVRLLDPTRLLKRLQRHTRFCFTRGFVITAAAVILLGAATLASNWDAFTADLPRLYQLSSLPVILLVLFLLVSAHEFGHGLTCRHFGGDVREMGFLLMYFTPALYCNVSDAWLFPEKRKRMWVGFAGPYFELLLWALAVLMWRITDSATTINHLALIVVAGSGVKTLFNFNPLIKLDGYYLLSDYLELPNLRSKSFRYVGDLLKAAVGWSDPPAPKPPREQHVYLTYGLLATFYSFSLLALVTMEWGDLLVAHSQPAAVAVLSGLVGVRLRRRVRGLLGKGADDEDDDPGLIWATAGREEATEVPAAATPAPPAPPETPAKPETPAAPAAQPTSAKSNRLSKRQRRLRRRAAWLGALAATVLATFIVRVQLRISGPVSVLPSENADVRAAVEGIVETVLVHEGQKVRAGDVIARLSAGALLTDLRGAEAEITEVSAGLGKLRAGPTKAEVELARAAVARAQDRVGYARTRLSRFQQLYELSAATRPELEDAHELATTANNDLVEARSRLNVLMASVRPEEIEAFRARVARLSSRRRFLEEQVALLTVVSPVDGVVATPERQLHAMERQLVSKGALIAKVYDFRSLTAQIALAEKEMAELRVGQAVELRTRAYPSVTFHGTVTAIGTAALGTPTGDPTSATTATTAAAGSGTTFIITTRIRNDSLLLRPGMTGQAKVFAGERRVIDVLARRVTRTLKVEVWSWW